MRWTADPRTHVICDPVTGKLRAVPPDYLARRRLLRAARAGRPFAVALLMRKFRLRYVPVGEHDVGRP